MAIAKVESVTNSCFIDGNPATKGQMINYGTVIETYDIKKGMEKSAKSRDYVDDGILSLFFLEDGSSMKIKPHVKVIFKANSRGLSPTSKTVELDPESEMATPNYKLVFNPIGEIGLPLGHVMIKEPGQSKFRRVRRTGYPVRFGEIIKTGMKSRIAVKFYNLFGGGEFRMGQNSEILLTPDNIKRAVTEHGQFWGTFLYLKGKKLPKHTPTAVCAIRG